MFQFFNSPLSVGKSWVDELFLLAVNKDSKIYLIEASSPVFLEASVTCQRHGYLQACSLLTLLVSFHEHMSSLPVAAKTKKVA